MKTVYPIARVELELGALYSATIVPVTRGALAPDLVEIDIMPFPAFTASAALEVGDGSAGAFRSFASAKTLTGNGTARRVQIDAATDGQVTAVAFKPTTANSGERVAIEIRGRFEE